MSDLVIDPPRRDEPSLLRRVKDRVDRDHAQPLDVEAPRRPDHGVRDRAVRDPAGNMIRIQELR